jgi:hypothetical protein
VTSPQPFIAPQLFAARLGIDCQLEFAINLKRPKVGLAALATLLARAEEVIEHGRVRSADNELILT